MKTKGPYIIKWTAQQDRDGKPYLVNSDGTWTAHVDYARKFATEHDAQDHLYENDCSTWLGFVAILPLSGEVKT